MRITSCSKPYVFDPYRGLVGAALKKRKTKTCKRIWVRKEFIYLLAFTLKLPITAIVVCFIICL